MYCQVKGLKTNRGAQAALRFRLIGWMSTSAGMPNWRFRARIMFSETVPLH
jgi:hypothetical protein